MKIKYPRTYHLPRSPGISSDDKIQFDLSVLESNEVVVTLKMDGENTTMGSDYIHARSLDSNNHPSRNWVKQFHSSIKHNIPENWRICGENMYAEHSIRYENLDSYFLGFSIWDENNDCLSWNDTLIWFNLLGIIPVKEIYTGQFDDDLIEKIFNDNYSDQEGYVVRNIHEFKFTHFQKNVVKYVRQNHVQTDVHWSEHWTKNELRKQ